ncbi:TonB family protein [Novosphingobium sp. 9U]|uniref:TonB family protein n=1 Tax=Novosphingobium sp. 9U TaxID=2653158 RepID=UPI0012F35158|nr:TonB family protein [Novosphingobium sp. 9U]VWX54489.1 Energy transducer TonB [Novosphingobium sp. 9U]
MLRTRLAVGIFVAALHLGAIVLLVRAFAPGAIATVLGPVTAAFDIAITPPAVEPKPEPKAEPRSAEPQGKAAPAGKKASPREVTAPKPRIAVAKDVAPPVSGTGSADNAGARESGSGTGAGGFGQGTGAGGSGTGTGGGGGIKAVKIAGDIVSARDYPAATRALRLGSAVTVALTVGADGRVSGCRIVRASRDPEADRVTCQLATERFRFRPARDGEGAPVASVYGWQQRWFAPPAK